MFVGFLLENKDSVIVNTQYIVSFREISGVGCCNTLIECVDGKSYYVQEPEDVVLQRILETQ